MPRRHIDMLSTQGTSMDKLCLSTFKEAVTYIWQTIGMLNIFCKNPDTSWLLSVTNKVD
jgi:hypothetical protein